MADASPTQQQGTPSTPAAVVAPVPGSPEYNAAMAAKGAPAVDGQPPAGEPILGKFKTQDDLVKAYQELEKKLGTTPAADPAKPAAEGDPVKKPGLSITPEAQAAQDAVKGAGLDFNALQAEFVEKGELSAETYAKLDKGGIPKAMVDAYVEGQKAIAVQYEQKAFAEAGGEEQFKQMSAWAAKNMQPAEITAYNEAVESGDEAKMRFAVSGLKSRFTSAFGSAPNLVQGGTVPVTNGYASQAQMMADMAKPEYRADPAFRDLVMKRIEASGDKLFGVQAVAGVR
jgi:hypothetical protein